MFAETKREHHRRDMSPARKQNKRILITGATGMIGASLSDCLRRGGYEVIGLSRHAPDEECRWDAESGRPPNEQVLQNLDAIIHLAGTPIDCRWTESAQKSIYASRVTGTRVLCEAVLNLPPSMRPGAFICMSGASIYGNQRDEIRLDESAPPKHQPGDFLPKVALDWENAGQSMADAGIRTVWLRTGMVLAKHGGALVKIARPIRFFAGATLGSGKQHTPWISLQDLTSAIFFILRTPQVIGPVNMVAPHTLSHQDFCAAIAASLHRPLWFRIPAWLVRLAFGKMGQETILASSNPFPAKLLDAGFRFQHHEVGEALSDIFSADSSPKKPAGKHQK